MRKNSLAHGFTLIELLVVISIIGVMSGVILPSLMKIRVKADDVKRKNDIYEVQHALERYYAENGHYPISKCSGANGSPDGWICLGCLYQSSATYGICNNINGPVTISSLDTALSVKNLKDPKPTSATYSGYWYISDGVDYKFNMNDTPENLNNFPVELIDLTTCGLPITSDGECGTHGSYIVNGSYLQMKSIYISTPGAITLVSPPAS